MDALTVAVHHQQSLRSIHKRCNCQGNEPQAQIYRVWGPGEEAVGILVQPAVASGISGKERPDH